MLAASGHRIRAYFTQVDTEGVGVCVCVGGGGGGGEDGYVLRGGWGMGVQVAAIEKEPTFLYCI